MKRNYTTSIIQRGICLFLLVPLILGISISEMRASTQALYRAWDLNVYSMENMAWEYEVLENKEEREEKDKLEYYVIPMDLKAVMILYFCHRERKVSNVCICFAK